ncbi:MAG: hypothetical protein ACJA0Q_001716 [Saprospiraceae bacterium]|jgi:hypothetical protein
MKQRLKYLLGAAVGVLLITFLGVYILYSSYEEVFPNQENVNYHYGFYHEDIEEDWSEVSVDSSSYSFKMSYRLSRATRTPFVAGYITINDNTKSLAKYQDHNAVRINLKSNVGMRIPIMLTFDYKEGEKKKNGKPFPMLTLIKFIDYHEAGDYEIPLSEFRIPDWWYRVHRLHRDEVDINKITNIRGVIVGSCGLLREKVRDIIEIKKIEFYTDNSALYLKALRLTSVLTLIV